MSSELITKAWGRILVDLNKLFAVYFNMRHLRRQPQYLYKLFYGVLEILCRLAQPNLLRDAIIQPRTQMAVLQLWFTIELLAG